MRFKDLAISFAPQRLKAYLDSLSLPSVILRYRELGCKTDLATVFVASSLSLLYANECRCTNISRVIGLHARGLTQS
jgi:hypothetical protein